MGHCPALLVTRIDASSTEHVRRRDFSVEHLLAVSRRVKPGTEGQGLAGSLRAPASRRRRAPGILAGVRVRGYHRRLVFLQLPGVPQRHRSPPQLAWRPEQQRPYLERRGHHGASPRRHPSPTPEPENGRVRWRSGPIPTARGRSNELQGPKGWTVNEIPSTPALPLGGVLGSARRRPSPAMRRDKVRRRRHRHHGGFGPHRAATQKWAFRPVVLTLRRRRRRARRASTPRCPWPIA